MQDHIAVLLPNEHDVKKAQFDCKTKDVMFQLLSKEGFISTVDVLLCRGYLSAEDYAAWRHSRIPLRDFFTVI